MNCALRVDQVNTNFLEAPLSLDATQEDKSKNKFQHRSMNGRSGVKEPKPREMNDMKFKNGLVSKTQSGKSR